MTKSLPVTEPALLTALRDFPPGSLYSLGDKNQLLEALTLCRDGAVRPPQWARGRSELSVDVITGKEVSEVVLSANQNRLTASCDCAAAQAKSCPHRLAVLFFLKKALTPAAMSGWQANPKQLETIRAALSETPLAQPAEKKAPSKKPKPAAKKIAVPRKVAEFAVVLERRYGILNITATRNGLPAQSFDRDLPEALQTLLAPFYGYGYGIRPAAALATLLDTGKLAWPIYFRDEESLTRLTVSSPDPRQGRLRLDARGDGLWPQRVLDDGRALGRRLFWLGSWVADIDQQRLVLVDIPEVWALWDALMAEATPLANGDRIDWQNFLGLEFLDDGGGKAPLDGFQLQRGGEDQVVSVVALEDYSLEVATNSADDTVSLTAGIRTASFSLPLAARALSLFSEEVFQGSSAALSAFKRRRILYETFFAGRSAATKAERTRIVRAALQGPDFRKRSVTREARAILDHSFACAQRETLHLLFADERWQLLRRDRDREAELLAILYRHFGAPLFRNAPFPGEMELSRAAFFGRLPALLAELQAADIALRLNNRSALPATLKIDIDATSTDIDWFELRPEIRCDGELLSSETWRQALAEGVFEAGGRLWLLDEQGRAMLAVLADLGGSTGKKRGELVRIPRLHILDCLALRRLGATLRLNAEDEAILASLAHFETLPERPVPQLAATLRDYQRHGFYWLAFLYEHKFGACLADDMGLGKTIQAISLLAGLRQGLVASHCPPQTPHLVVVPPSLLFNWESEIGRFAPELRTLVYRGQERSTDFAGADVVLTSYDLVRRDIEELAAIPFHVIIFDEAQAVKNVHAGVTGAVRQLQGAFKLALTGTPVENHLGEYWSIIDLVLPGLLGEYRRFGGARTEIDPATIARLIARTHPFVLRRTKDKVATELPDKVEIDLHLELTVAQKALYQQTVADIRGEVDAAWQRQNSAQARITALAALTRLRRLCLDPRLVGGSDSEAAPKIKALCEQLTELLDEGHSVLVFSQFTSFLDLVEPALAAAALPWLRLDGSTPVGERKQLVERFQQNAAPLIFLLSLKAGGRGLNLTRATYVIHLDPWWNPAVENQASDRAHRIGQTRKVTILRYLMRHTVEEKMMLLKARKEQLYKALLEEGRGDGTVSLTREDFEFLVGG